MYGPSPIVKMIDTLKRFCSAECAMEGCPSRRSGMMCERSTDTIFQNRSISSQADFHARILVKQGLEQAWKVSEADFIGNCIDSSKKSAQLSFFSKTSRRSGLGALRKWSGHLPASGMTVAGRLYQPRKLEPRTFAKDGSCLPTPTGNAYGSSNNGCPGDGRREYRTKKKPSLETMARQGQWPILPTPRPCSGKRSSGLNRTEIMNGLRRWPTPRVSDIRGEGAGAAGRRIAQGAGCTLAGAVKLWPTPTVRDSNTLKKCKRGKNAVPGGTPLPIAVGGTLNPEFVEWLMMFPIGWTSCDAWAMELLGSKRKRRSKD